MNVKGKKVEIANAYDTPRFFQVNDEHGQPMWYNVKVTDDDPLGEKTRKPVRIRVCSTLSKTYRRADENNTTRILRAKKQKRTDGGESKKRGSLMVAECCNGWEGFFNDEEETEEFNFTTPHADELFRAFPFIQSQTEEEMEDLEAFTAAASPASQELSVATAS